MRIFFVGDFNSNNGPANANKTFISGLSDREFSYSKCKSKPSRVLEFFAKVPFASILCLCSGSAFNVFVTRIAKLLGKNVYYLMHGCGSYEYEVNAKFVDKKILNKIKKREHYLFKNAKLMICVSKTLMMFMQEREPHFANKFDYSYNGVDIKEISDTAAKDNIQKKDKLCISTGGGTTLKNNLEVCRAIELLNKQWNMNLEYIVAGKAHGKENAFSKYEFVTYCDRLPHEKVIEKMCESRLFISNSSFESFSLSVIEAIMCDCSLLVSQEVGALGVFATVCEDDIIINPKDIDEIAGKIKRIFENPNNERLREGLAIETITDINASRNLYNKICFHEGRHLNTFFFVANQDNS
jgi:glycosyltransferase involved in cell wall biosynthesis